jgi:hypothetical protein
MKGIYLTPEGKQELEAKIAELEKEIMNEMNVFIHTATNAELDFYNKILSSATILPVAETWHDIHEEDVANWSEINYSKGVIIQPKQ